MEISIKGPQKSKSRIAHDTDVQKNQISLLWRYLHTHVYYTTTHNSQIRSSLGADKQMTR
jgi:hypothetical protein